MSLSGVLEDFGVAEIFQLIAQQRKTGVLEVTKPGRELHVFFSEGQVVRARPPETRPDATLGEFLLRTGSISETDLAEAWRLQGESLEPLARVLETQKFVGKADLERIAALVSDETLFELFRWSEGRFEFEAARIEPEVGDRLVGAEAVLLDALRMTDEWRQIESVLPDLRVVLVRAVDIEEFNRVRTDLEAGIGLCGADLERVFTLVNGRLTARRAIDLSRLGTFQGGRAIAGLLREHQIEISARAPKVTRKPRLRRAAVGSTQLVLALAATAAIGIASIPPSVSTSVPLGRSALDEARAASEQERIRAVLESHRVRTGAYPEALPVLRGAGSSASILAGVSLDRYIYARTPGGYVLFRAPSSYAP